MRFCVELITASDRHIISVPSGETILDIAENVYNIDLPYSCRAGSCSSCVAKVTQGSVNQEDGSFLDDDQKTEGYALLCVSYPLSNCIIETDQEENL